MLNTDREINIIVNNGNLLEGDKRNNFQEEEVIYESDKLDMYDILVKYNFFKSKKECRNNWKFTGKELPEGFIDIPNIGKLNRRLTILNPIKDEY